jgi:hypothetical protein
MSFSALQLCRTGRIVQEARREPARLINALSSQRQQRSMEDSMTRTLEHATIMIVAGRSLSTFRLQKDLEDCGASVCVTRLADVNAALRHTRPSAVIVDFSLANAVDGLDDLEAQGIPHLVCRSPNKYQSHSDQVLASRHVASALTGLVERSAPSPRWLSDRDEIDRDLYAI